MSWLWDWIPLLKSLRAAPAWAGKRPLLPGTRALKYIPSCYQLQLMKIEWSCPGIQRRQHAHILSQAPFPEAWLLELKGKYFSHNLLPLRHFLGKYSQFGGRRQNNLDQRSSNFSTYQNHTEGLLKLCTPLGPAPKVSDSVGVRKGLRCCIFLQVYRSCYYWRSGRDHTLRITDLEDQEKGEK